MPQEDQAVITILANLMQPLDPPRPDRLARDPGPQGDAAAAGAGRLRMLAMAALTIGGFVLLMVATLVLRFGLYAFGHSNLVDGERIKAALGL